MLLGVVGPTVVVMAVVTVIIVTVVDYRLVLGTVIGVFTVWIGDVVGALVGKQVGNGCRELRQWMLGVQRVFNHLHHDLHQFQAV